MRDPWNHNLEYQRWLFDQVPDHCDHALDVGCGDGWFARRLAERVTWVTGIDLSAPMIERARQTAAGLPNLTFEVGNLLDHSLPGAGFDFVSAVAVLHHLPFVPALTRLAALLRPDGVLAVIGLAKDASVAKGHPSGPLFTATEVAFGDPLTIKRTSKAPISSL